MNSHLHSTASLLRGIPLRSIPRRRERHVSPRLDCNQKLPALLRVSLRLDCMLQIPATYQRLDLNTNHPITYTAVTDVLV